MNIEEILDCLELAIDSESYKELLDYITNLQQENERLKEEYKNKLYKTLEVYEKGELVGLILPIKEY